MKFNFNGVAFFAPFVILLHFTSALHIDLSESVDPQVRQKRGLEYLGGCTDPPPAPISGKLRCNPSGCRAMCNPEHSFPNGETLLHVDCKDGIWLVRDNLYAKIPDCTSTNCKPPCLNGGVCAEGKCKCPPYFSGQQCEVRSCAQPPNTEKQKYLCTPTICRSNCFEGYEFPDGTSAMQATCVNGVWVLADGNPAPTCEAACKPKCKNGGMCVSPNKCQCAPGYEGSYCENVICEQKCLNDGICTSPNKCSCLKGFKGPQCEYDTSKVCNFNQLDFNGLFECNTGENSVQCVLSCPNGAKSNNPFAEVYTCKFSVGKFEPDIPECVNEEPTTKEANKEPKPGNCFTWSGTHYKTFDGLVYSFTAPCSYVLVEDIADNTFTVVTENNFGCNYSIEDSCSRIIKIYYQEKEYIFKRSVKGNPMLLYGDKVLYIPGKVPGMRIQVAGSYVIITLDNTGVKIKWDGNNLIQVRVDESLWEKTGGLCGKLDGYAQNDLSNKNGEKAANVADFTQSWQVQSDLQRCTEDPITNNPCKDNQDKAKTFCENAISNALFDSCKKVMDIRKLLDACIWSYCACMKSDPQDCMCETLNMYVRECRSEGLAEFINWRENICPMKCSESKIYKTCAPEGGEVVCGDIKQSTNNEECEEGCYCEKDMVLYNDKCISPKECPCQHHGKEMPIGSTVPKECNSCTCNEGKWECTNEDCTVRCSSVGDPHYMTFDGKRYDFMGHCNYYLIKHVNFSIVGENVPCVGTVEEMAGFLPLRSSDLPSCTKGSTINYGGHVIKLKQNFEILVDGKDITDIPFTIDGISIRQASSTFVIVELPNRVQIMWDGASRLLIDAPPSLYGQTQGLCGTFNNNENDDFLTPDGDIEVNEIAFGNKWKTDEKCIDMDETSPDHPCVKNPSNKAPAQKNCKMIKSDIFSECHWEVDPEPFYQECLFDVCSCELKLPRCFCPMIASYAAECARHGVYVEWRDKVKGCGIQCKGGQTYQACADTCGRTCTQIATNSNCVSQCAEGCNCPKGQALNDQEECVPIEKCECVLDGVKYPSEHKNTQIVNTTKYLCECKNAKWDCSVAPEVEESIRFKIPHQCEAKNNEEYTLCKSSEPVTCKNMHYDISQASTECMAGCQCKSGYVLNSCSKKCVEPIECPCYHGGQSYNNGDIIKTDCNNCTCDKGKWTCTQNKCPAMCSTWGDSHFKTFDSKMYNFQGQCDYVLSRGELDADRSFQVNIQNVPCGSLGVACSKSLTVFANIGNDKENITLSEGKKIPDTSYQHLLVRKISQYVFVEIPELEVTVTWDKGTRVYVTLSTNWQNKVKGLCGNYNDNSNDDFQTPSGEIGEISTQVFGDSWRLQSYCSETEEITNTCENRSARKIWALKKCGILKSSVFAKCHSAVPVTPFVDNCIFDSCACDQGGDCECLCTALAAYAYECNKKGIHVSWRTPDLCPMQCDSTDSTYSPCVTTCVSETCDNSLFYNKLNKNCKDEVCVEGCKIKDCPEGSIYLNSKLKECVPRDVCKPFCMIIDGKTYYEGDVIEKDGSQTCYCLRGKKDCKSEQCDDCNSLKIVINRKCQN